MIKAKNLKRGDLLLGRFANETRQAKFTGVQGRFSPRATFKTRKEGESTLHPDTLLEAVTIDGVTGYQPK